MPAVGIPSRRFGPLLLRLTKNLDEKAPLAQGSLAMTSLCRSSRTRKLARAGALVLLGGTFAGCAAPQQRKPIEMAPIGTVPVLNRTAEESEGGTTTTPNAGTPAPVTLAKESACMSAEFEALDDALRQCAGTMPRGADLPSHMRDKLDVVVTTATPAVAPGGHVDVTVTFKNRTNEPLPLYFTGDPFVHFEIEAVDGRGRRVDLPTGKPPKGSASSTAHDVKVSRITLAPAGVARVKLGWEAVKTRWASADKSKASDGRGPQRVPAGPLGAGKYTLRVMLPLVGAFGAGGIEVPKLAIDVGS
jgi:hypothetical protein